MTSALSSKGIWLGLIVLMFGCATSPMGISKTREKLNQLEIGMNKDQVLKLMGQPLEFLIYLTQYTYSGPIPDSDKTPLCLRDGKLIGWGRNFYDNTQKYDVRIKGE